MKFGTIGAGAVAFAFAREALARGHEVVLSSRRGPDALADKVTELGRGASAAHSPEGEPFTVDRQTAGLFALQRGGDVIFRDDGFDREIR